MDLEGDNMEESGITLGFDLAELDDGRLLDISDLFPDDLLESADCDPINYYQLMSRPAPVHSPSFKSESVTSRTQLRQQLMKDQLLKERERQQPRAPAPRPTPNSQPPRPGKLPVSVQKVALPQHVLQVSTGLHNPTKYHIMEKQKNQVFQFLSSADKSKSHLGVAVSSDVAHRPGPAGPSTSRPPSASFTVPPPSPGMQSVTSGGTSEAEDVIESILSFEETSDTRLYGSNASLDSQKLKSEPDIENYEEEGGKDRVKKETHNMIERRRRYNINDRIKELGDLLPHRNEPHYDLVRDSRSNKGTILKSSVDYIRLLKDDVSKMKQMETDNRQLQLENRKLLLRIQHLEIKAQERGVALEDGERVWRPAPAEHIIAKYVLGEPHPPPHMPDVVPDTARLYDDSMDDLPAADPMLTSAATPSVQMDME